MLKSDVRAEKIFWLIFFVIHFCSQRPAGFSSTHFARRWRANQINTRVYQVPIRVILTRKTPRSGQQQQLVDYSHHWAVPQQLSPTSRVSCRRIPNSECSSKAWPKSVVSASIAIVLVLLINTQMNHAPCSNIDRSLLIDEPVVSGCTRMCLSSSFPKRS